MLDNFVVITSETISYPSFSTPSPRSDFESRETCSIKLLKRLSSASLSSCLLVPGFTFETTSITFSAHHFPYFCSPLETYFTGFQRSQAAAFV